MTGDDHDLDGRVPLPDQPHGLKSVHTRHENIEEQQVEVLAVELLQAAAAVIGGDHLMSGPFQQHADDGLDRGVVVDDQDFRQGWWSPVCGRITSSTVKQTPNSNACSRAGRSFPVHWIVHARLHSPGSSRAPRYHAEPGGR